MALPEPPKELTTEEKFAKAALVAADSMRRFVDLLEQVWQYAQERIRAEQGDTDRRTPRR